MLTFNSNIVGCSFHFGNRSGMSSWEKYGAGPPLILLSWLYLQMSKCLLICKWGYIKIIDHNIIMSALGAIQRRVMVADDDLPQARLILQEWHEWSRWAIRWPPCSSCHAFHISQMCSITEALIYATAGIFGTLAVGILWMKTRGDYQDANVGRWLGVLGIITLLFLAQDWVCGWPLAT